jgi:hypothetical protein
MSRLDWGAGRFTVDYDTSEIQEGLRGWQSDVGDRVVYYRFFSEQSQQSDIWDEGSGVGRIFHPPMEIPVLHATHVEGGNEARAQGFYFNDDLYVTASFEQLKLVGLTEMDIQHYSYLKDRIVYDLRVFRVERMQILGQIQRRDTVVSIEGTQIKPDEMYNDAQFEEFTHVPMVGT